MNNDAATLVSAADFLAHWQGHRRLSRRVVEAFPDDQLFTFSAGGMRTAGKLMLEVLFMPEPTLQGVATGDWSSKATASLNTIDTKAALLKAWDGVTAAIDEIWATIPEERFLLVDTAFGQWRWSNVNTLRYLVDNEIHHRGQCYVYLRLLGIEPPAFPER